MNSNDKLSKGRAILGLAMILVGIFCTISQLTNSGGLRADFSQGLAYAATVQTGSDMPRVESAQAETRAVTGTLDATFRGILTQAEKPEWVGYRVDEIAGDRSVCCGNYSDSSGCLTCRLENDHTWTSGGTKSGNQTGGTVKLEGSGRLVVLFRLEAKQVDRIRVASEDCTLDAGGLPFLWLTGFKPAESVALLTTYVQGAEFER
ncbi:MAG TPA: hypothetical protein VNB49_08455, partial [Candidatus Dormibacteraeota bacterium]|nr:hypothetical protein [Candidatus Dormibacteraeota bacterium]